MNAVSLATVIAASVVVLVVILWLLSLLGTGDALFASIGYDALPDLKDRFVVEVTKDGRLCLEVRGPFYLLCGVPK